MIGHVMLIRSVAVATAIGVSLSACSGLTQMQDSLSKFDQGTHAVASAQESFFGNVQAFDCTTQFYAQTQSWAVGASTDFDLTGSCTPTLISNNQIAIRKNLLDAISLYADKLQALASSAEDKTLDGNAQSLASKLNNLASSHGLIAADASIGSDVEAGIIAISEMALDQRRFNDAKSAAKEMAPNLSAIVKQLKSENISFVSAVQSKRGLLEIKLRSVISTIPANNPSERFASVISARHLYMSANPFGAESLTSASAQPTPDASALNNALDGLVKANDAIATAGQGAIANEVSDLVSRAQAARVDQAAIAK
jgi:hypothetical protein